MLHFGARQVPTQRTRAPHAVDMEDFLRTNGLQEYYPRFMAQGIDDVDDVRRERRMDALLDSVGMTANPGVAAGAITSRSIDASEAKMKPRDEGVPVHGHVRKFKEALHAAAGDATGKKRKKGGGEEVAVDPAEAIRQAMAASKARGGGSLGGGAWRDDSVARPTAAGRVALGKSGDAVVGAVNDRIGVASEEEIHDILRHFRSKDYLKLLGLPGAPVDRYGKVEWQTHVVNRPGEIAVKSKVMSLRVEPSRNKHPQAAEAYAAVNEAARTLQDKEGKKSILTLAVQRRVDEMRRKGEGDVQGGYVSMTGVHYAAGAAASQVANYKGEDDGAHGPAMNPGASLKPPTSALNAMARGGDDDAAREAAAVARERLVRANANTGGGGGGKQAAPKVDLGSIRDKLKKKKPSFM